MKKLTSFNKFLETTSLNKNNKKALLSIIDFVLGKDIPKLSEKIFLFEGDPGVGKTYLAEKLIKSIDLPVFFLGSSKLNGKNINQFDSLTKLIEKLDELENGIVFMDDLRYILDFDSEIGELDNEDRKKFMKILEHFKRSEKRIVFIMTLNDSGFLEDSWVDRIDIQIEFNLPSEENKLGFLEENFGKYAKINELKYLAKNSVGYNYRDLPQLIKIAYREGNKSINMTGIKKAFYLYTPSSLRGWDIKREIKTKFENIIGHNDVKKELKKLIIYLEQKEKLQKMGINQSNLFIFHGHPGVGKTHMATALAGELNLPLVKINAKDIWANNPFRGINGAINAAKQFKNSVIFMDDFDKVVGVNSFSLEEEGPLISEFNAKIEEADIQGIIILAANNIHRFGKAMKDRFKVINFNLPSFDDRKNFVKNLIEKSKLDLKIDNNHFAKITENMNYRQMQRIWNECVFYYLQNKTFSHSILEEFVSEGSTISTRESMFT